MVGLAGVLMFNGLLDVQLREHWRRYLVIERPIFVGRYPGRVMRTQRLVEPSPIRGNADR